MSGLGDATAAGPRLVIVGTGLDAMFSAAVLARWLPGDAASIRVLESGKPADVAAPGCDATLPLSDFADAVLALDDDATLLATHGAFSCGIAVSGWAEPSSAWFHAFGGLGAPLGPVSFVQVMARLRREGSTLRLADHALAALAAQAGRFARPDGDPRSVRSTLEYGLHLDTRELSALCRRRAIAAGVCFDPGTLEAVEWEDDGRIAALRTRDGSRLVGDCYLDCSGSAAVLADPRRAQWLDWSAWLPCDRKVLCSMPGTAAPPPYSVASALDTGWIRRVPGVGRTGLSLHFSSALNDDAQALARLGMEAGGVATDKIVVQAQRRGRCAEPWQGNTLALGEAAAGIEPLAASALQLLCADLLRFATLLPSGGEHAGAAREYNRRAALYLDDARDFAIAHYRLNGRHGEPFWDACRVAAVPDSLQAALELYLGLGRVATRDEPAFPESAWLALFDGQGLRPRRCNPLAEGLGVARLSAHVGRVRERMLEELARMPAHGDYLATLRADGNPGRAVGAEPFGPSTTTAWGRNT